MIAVFIAYIVVLIGIVAYSARRSKTNTDFVLGGKKISGISPALSERATGESAWLLLGLTGLAYAEGMAAIWVALGCVSGILFLWTFLAGPLQKLTAKTDALTVPGLFSKSPISTCPCARISAWAARIASCSASTLTPCASAICQTV